MEGQFFLISCGIYLEPANAGYGRHQLCQAADQAVVVPPPNLLPLSPKPLRADLRRDRQQHIQSLLPAEHQNLLKPPEVVFPFFRLPTGPQVLSDAQQVYARRGHIGKILPDLGQSQPLYTICRTENQSGMLHMLNSRVPQRILGYILAQFLSDCYPLFDFFTFSPIKRAPAHPKARRL